MAGFDGLMPNLFELNQLASTQGLDYWISLGVNLILSTIVGGIILIIVIAFFNRRYGGVNQPGKTFFVVLIINFINFFGFLGIILPLIVGMPILGLILPILVWIIILTLVFHDLHFIHNIIIGIIAYVVTLSIVPYITSLVTG